MPEHSSAAGRAKRQELLEKARARSRRSGEPPPPGPELAELLDQNQNRSYSGAAGASRAPRPASVGRGGSISRAGTAAAAGGSADSTQVDALRLRLAKLEGQLADKGEDAARWRRALQTQREEHRAAIQQLDGLQQVSQTL